MRTDIVTTYIKLKQKLLAERAELEQRLRQIYQALGAPAAVEAIPAMLVAPSGKPRLKPKRRLSAAGRRRIIRATKARWAKIRAQQAAASPPKRKMSAAARAKLAAIARARWAKVKQAGKSRL